MFSVLICISLKNVHKIFLFQKDDSNSQKDKLETKRKMSLLSKTQVDREKKKERKKRKEEGRKEAAQ